MTNPTIQIDITGVAIDAQFRPGNKYSDLHNIGIVPNGIDGGRSLHVSNWHGSRVVVRDYQDDSIILASGNGWSNAMQALADHYGVPVQVSRDYGVVGGKSGKVLGFWSPTAPAPALPKLTKAQVVTLRLAAEGVLSYTPSNVDHAPRHAWRGPVFKGHAKAYGFKSDIKTESAAVLDKLGMLSYDYTGRGNVAPSQLGLNWLAAHPA